MSKKLFFALIILFAFNLNAQYANVPGQLGSTAISKDSSIIIAWATGISIERGYLDINDKSIVVDGSNKVSYGEPINALYFAEGTATDCVSLGDSGIAIVNFASSIYDGVGPDFAIFENGFGDNYLELAFVEVSSDGIHFVRFPSSSLFQTTSQVGPFAYASCVAVNNLAGKYRQGYGTPFDLAELADSTSLDLTNITHVKIVDAIGSITNIGGLDTAGNRINDCYPTPFASGGFDLDAVGAMYMNPLGLKENQKNTVSIYPNPSKGIVSINTENQGVVTIQNLLGEIVFTEKVEHSIQIDLSNFSGQILIVKFENEQGISSNKITIY